MQIKTANTSLNSFTNALWILGLIGVSTKVSVNILIWLLVSWL